LSKDGSADDAYTERIYWSPDSKKLVALRTRKGQEHKVHLIESSPRDQLQPKLHSFDYLKPGDRIPITKPHLFDVTARKEIAVKDDLFPNPWSVQDVRWAPDSRDFTFLYNQRGHQVLRVVAVDAESGAACAIVDEQSKTFIDYNSKFFIHYLDSTNEIIWMSERDGWNHLYLYDAATGRVKNQITKGAWVVRGVDRVDEKTREIWFHASGYYRDQDPYYLHYFRVNFDGTHPVALTEGDGTHRVEYSPDRRFLIDTYSRVDLAPVTELRRVADGKLLCALERADAGALSKTGWKAPERFVAKGRDGKTDIYGVLFRPIKFDVNKKYPVIEQIYAGPQGAFVPKEFRPFFYPQQLAELGFIVVQIDGMGTNYRSKAFHDVCWKNLGDAGLPDRIHWLKAAAAKYPYLDLSRVGIYGGSAGGQSALRAVLAYPEFYKAAAANCGCHDNRKVRVLVSAHPRSGLRTQPDDILNFIDNFVVPDGSGPSRFRGADMLDALQDLERLPFLSSGGESGRTVEFPFGEQTSLLRLTTDKQHPELGNGLQMRLTLPVGEQDQSEADGVRRALELNEREIREFSRTHLLGCWQAGRLGPTHDLFLS
jgi:dipeptidyl-peptidase-4